MSTNDNDKKRPKPDHEAIEAILAADPRCEKDDSPDDPPESSTRVTPDELERMLEANPRFQKMEPEEEGETTITFLGKEATDRFRKQQEKAEDD